MPSKAKKHSKTPSHSNQSSSSSPSSTYPPDSELSPEVLSRSLEDASTRFPSLISKSAFIGRVSDVDHKVRGFRIWMSESAMVSSSFISGSIVSVSLASSRKNILSGFPLDSLTDGCARHFGIDAGDRRASEVGNYFALAVVFASKVSSPKLLPYECLPLQVLKNEVGLSWDLSCTIGCPASGRIMFVFPIHSNSVTGFPNGTGKLYSSTNTTVPCLSMQTCKELYLELVPSKNGSTVNGDMLSPVNCPSTTIHDQFENGKVSSPRTPLSYESKVNSPVTSRMLSTRCAESVSSLCKSNVTSFDTSDIREVLRDESIKKVLQNLAAVLLHTRSLLHGNLVAIQMLSGLCFFRVEGAEKLSKESPNPELTDEENHDSLPRTPNLVDHVDGAFVVVKETKVHLYTPSPSGMETLYKRGLSPVELECRDVKANVGSDFSKLGGLSKEFALLKEIIVSSTVKDTLSSLGLRTTKGVLLHGPPGTGKTSLARSCARGAGVNLFSVNGPEIVSQYYGGSEKALHEVFDSASRAAPAVVFIDELDAIAPARKDGGEELSQRMVATLLNLMDGISRTDGLLVIAATNRPDSIDPALRRPGRLDREIEIGVPSPKQRLDILLTLLTEMDHSLVDMQVQHLASTTHGFVGADLAALCNEAAYVCLRRYVKYKKSSDSSTVTPHLHSNETGLVYDGFSNCIIGGSDSVKDKGGLFSTDHLGSAASSLSDLTVSSEIPPSFGTRALARASIVTSQNTVNSNSVKAACITEDESMLKLTFEDFEKAKMKVRPSAMREVCLLLALAFPLSATFWKTMIGMFIVSTCFPSDNVRRTNSQSLSDCQVILEVPKVRWEDVGGQDEVKKQLMEAVEWPQKHQDAFKRIGTRPPTGVLMFGPPGCSKTLMARAVASEAGLNFLAVKGPELFSKWVGESEKAVKSLFAKARANAPSIIFFDEIDGLAIIRGKENDGASVGDRVMSQLLVELDGLQQRGDVTVIAATNRPDKIDPALLRPGRFDRMLYVGPPNEIAREDIFHIHLRKMSCSSDVSISELAQLTEGYTGADISLICREAAIAAIKESRDASEISMEHFKNGIGRVQPSEIQSYQDLSAKFQRLVHTDSTRDHVGRKPYSSISHWIPFWTWMKSIMLWLFRLPTSLFPSKAC
ncbi:hypothetical protein HHK36_019699 [Tetracentron sinense]|uniref:AAA+ ATPase domain-containing protein n=1 Tax=Tetracentron sinense TaxID=13715 RepID=A0A835D9D4_TETSI|nr:hypothetical protein HHK36_019699 [Tetracentron sinense]